MDAAELSGALDDPDVEVRRGAILRLGAELGPASVGLLVRGLGDTDWRVREEAVRAGAGMADVPGLLPALVAAVSQGDNVGLRNAALGLLGQLGERAVDELVAALPGAGDSARRFLIEALAGGGDGRVHAALVAGLSSADANLVVVSIDALGRIGGPKARAALLGLLAREDSYLRLCALEALSRLGGELPFETLVGLLSDKLLRRAALEALGRGRDPRALTPLVQALQDSSARIVQAAVHALHGWLEAAHQIDAVQAALRGLDPPTQSRLRAQAEAGDAGAAALALLAREGAGLDVGLQLWADRGNADAGWLNALQAWGEPGVLALLDRARAAPERIRAVALELACHRVEGGAAGLVDALRSALRGALQAADAGVRQAALEGMGRWAEARDAPAIAQGCLDVAPEAAASAARALLALAERQPQAVRDALAQLDLTAFGEPVLMRLLVVLEGEAALARLQQALTHHDASVRVAAIEALVLLGTPSAAEVIVLSLTDESEDVQAVAARALGELWSVSGSRVGVDALLLALENAAAGVQAAAAQALGRAAEPRVIAALRGRLRHAEPMVQLAAVEALRRFEGPEVGELMVEALGHADPEVVKQALHGIAERPHPRLASRIALALGHSSWDVRQLAATLLGGLDRASALAPLEARLGQEGDALVREAIEGALARLGEGG